MSWLRKLRKTATSNPEAGWECLECGHREYCTRKVTFWVDVGRTLFAHRNPHHLDGMDYIMHVPHGWEREQERRL